MQTWDNCHLDKNKQHILVRKRWADTDLKFFPGSNMLVHWVWHPLWGVPEFGACKLSSPYIFMACFLLTSSPYHILPSTLERTQVVPSLSSVVSGAEISTSACTCAWDFETLVFKVIFGLVIHQLMSAIFPYLSIHSISYEPFNYVTAIFTWNHLTVCKRMNSGSFKKVINKRCFQIKCVCVWH